MSTRHASVLMLLGASALAVAAACAKSVNKTDTTAAMSADTTSKAAAAPTTPAPAALTDTNIFALLDEANAADSSLGALAATKATNASVRSFGKRMAHDHHELRKQGAELAKKLNITPNPPANDTLTNSAQKITDSLNAQPKGAAWDAAYMDHEVAAHQGVLALLQAAGTAATDTSLKALIAKAQPLIQNHLTMAQGIQGKLSATASTAGGAASPGNGTTDTAATPHRAGKKKTY